METSFEYAVKGCAILCAVAVVRVFANTLLARVMMARDWANPFLQSLVAARDCANPFHWLEMAVGEFANLFHRRVMVKVLPLTAATTGKDRTWV